MGWAAERRAKNVILFLGDAGGIPTLHAASVYRYQEANKLFIQHRPHMALSDTSTASSWVTDSAAGMTAIVTGQRTHSSVLWQSDAAVRGKKDGEPLKTILEYAEERGLSTGVISNDSVAGATPGACYAHSNDCGKTGEIFAQVLTWLRRFPARGSHCMIRWLRFQRAPAGRWCFWTSQTSICWKRLSGRSGSSRGIRRGFF